MAPVTATARSWEDRESSAHRNDGYYVGGYFVKRAGYREPSDSSDLSSPACLEDNPLTSRREHPWDHKKQQKQNRRSESTTRTRRKVDEDVIAKRNGLARSDSLRNERVIENWSPPGKKKEKVNIIPPPSTSDRKKQSDLNWERERKLATDRMYSSPVHGRHRSSHRWDKKSDPVKEGTRNQLNQRVHSPTDRKDKTVSQERKQGSGVVHSSPNTPTTTMESSSSDGSVQENSPVREIDVESIPSSPVSGERTKQSDLQWMPSQKSTQAYRARPSSRKDKSKKQPKEEVLTAECHWQKDKHTPATSSRIVSVVRFKDCFLKNFEKIIKEPAYRHAQKAGVLWQTLNAQHVKFPKHWWNGARSPTMGVEIDGNRHMYNYIARHRVYSNPTFNSLVKTRSSAGRLLLHVVIRNADTHVALQDVVVGCFHPNARGIRSTDEADPKEEECRVIWMATRSRVKDANFSLIESLLTRGRSLQELCNESPLGSKSWVSNQNMRDVFGDKPPLQTVFITEHNLNDVMVAAEEQNSFAAPALVLLREYLFP